MKQSLLLLLINCCLCPLAFAESLTYKHLYLSYVSANVAQSIANYVQAQHLGGMILREFGGDTQLNDKRSLLRALNQPLTPDRISHKKPMVMGLWSNEQVNSNDALTRAIPGHSYGVPGSRDKNGFIVKNQDFTEKLRGMDGIIYGFLAAQTKTHTYFDNKTYQMITISNKTPDMIGTLYFTDPRADLATSGSSAIQDAFCRKNSAICDFTLFNRSLPIDLKDGVKMGNFTTFSALGKTDPDPKQELPLKLISVGGPHHEATFEDTFSSSKGIENFVNSAKALITAFELDGIDLDYENPKMTPSSAESFTLLVRQLKAEMPDKLISVTILSEEAYVNGTLEGPYGFANGTLSDIATHVSRINLITYHADGILTDPLDGTIISRFLTNLHRPINAPNAYQFSIENAVETALQAGVSPEQLMVTIPAYGRSIAGVSHDNGGLFNPIPTTAILPRGDLDHANCSTDFHPLTPGQCTGAFQYHYILEEMLTNGLEETNHESNGIVIGTTAYALEWSPSNATNYQLKITNLGKLSDIAFHVTIGDYNVPDFFNINTDKTYDARSTSSINGLEDLAVKWSTSWGPSGQCPTKLNFSRDTHVIMKVTPDNNSGKYLTYCTFAALGDYLD